MAVSVAVCDIFSVKEWRNLENQVMEISTTQKTVENVFVCQGLGCGD